MIENKRLQITYAINLGCVIYTLNLLHYSNIPNIWIIISFFAKLVILFINAIQLYNLFKYNYNCTIGFFLTIFALIWTSTYSWTGLIISSLFLLLSFCVYVHCLKKQTLHVYSNKSFSMWKFKNRIAFIKDCFEVNPKNWTLY